MAAAIALILAVNCGGDDAGPSSAVTGGAGGQPPDAGPDQSVTGGSGGTIPDGSAGASGAWGQGPGIPGSVTEIGQRMAHVQGMSSRLVFQTLSGENKCPPADGGTDADADGAAGAAGGDAAGKADAGADASPEAATDAGCASSYTAGSPDFDLSGISTTSVNLALPTIPVFEPIDQSGQCPLSGNLIENARLYLADCTQTVSNVPVFTAADIDGFFGASTVLARKDNIEIDGATVSTITGLALKSALCGNSAYLVSNASGTLIRVSLDADAGYPRTNHDTGYAGLSGIACGSGNTVIVSTSRTWTQDSWNAAGGASDPSLLVEHDPVRIIAVDPAAGTQSVLTEISGGSRMLTQGYAVVGSDDAGAQIILMPGTANVLTLATDGDFLFGDHLSGSVWKIKPDGSAKTMLFQTPRAFTGLVQAPNGVLFLALNPRADLNCTTILSPPVIAAYNETSGTVDDWLALTSPAYAALLPALCNTGIIERDYSAQEILIGGGNFNDLVADPLYPVLFVTESLRSVTRAIEITYIPPEAGADADTDADADTGTDADTDAIADGAAGAAGGG